MARDHRWDALARKFKAQCRARNEPCWLCVRRGHKPTDPEAQIDYAAPRFAARAFEADHILDWESHPMARYSLQNCAASHSRCNRQRRDEAKHNARITAPKPVKVFTEWQKPDW
jgi:HNH endonuclease